ncbi:MAG: hypothetical protein VX642_00505 [Bdellovibrionota bacterium]|nr:hypothetical protein [Bdellovibrionota bacterium]
MKIINLLLAFVVGLSSLSLSANQKFVVSDAQSFVETLAGDFTTDEIEFAVEDKEAFVAELVDLRLITAEEGQMVFEKPEHVLETAVPTGNASHYHRRRYLVANPLWWLAALIVLTTPAYY